MTSGRKTNPTPQRLDPEERKSLILDAAAALVANEGVSVASMQRIAKEARVSKALVYFYFDSRINLLRALRIREQKRLATMQREAVGQANDFWEIARLTTRAYLDHAREKGSLLQRLRSEPALAQTAADIETKGFERSRDFVARHMAETYNLPLELSKVTTNLCMGLTEAAGSAVVNTDLPIEVVEEIALSLFQGGMPKVALELGSDDTSDNDEG